MKKQKLNGKLRLKKNVISGFKAGSVIGGRTKTCGCSAITCPTLPTFDVENCMTELAPSDCACL